MDITRIRLILLLITIFTWAQTSFAYPGFSSRYWASAEILYWWTNDSTIPIPLATKNNIPGALAIIGQPGTEIILGSGSSQNSFDFDGMRGLRLTFGGWLDDTHCYGLEASAFGLAPKTEKMLANPVVDVPFFSTTTGSENVLVGGRVNNITDENTLGPSSFEINMLYRIPRARIPLVVTAGFRYMNIDDKVVLIDSIFNTPSLPPGAALNVEDTFNARNHFYGLQLGARTKTNYCNFVFEGKAQIAFGMNYQRLAIHGQTNVNNQTVLQPIGLFAEPTNSGTFTHEQFAMLPELQIKLGYNGINYLSPFITWNLLYMNNVNRAAKQIDRNINQSQNPLLGGTGTLIGAPAPQKQFRQSSFWLQGISIGVSFG